jgi:hypothetical protein
MSSVIRDTLRPFIRFKGATHAATKLTILILPSFKRGFTAPKARILSNGIPKSVAYTGSRYIALNAVPKIVIVSVPAMHAMMAVFLFFLKAYTADAGRIKLQPMTKLASSPTNGAL